MKLHRSPIRIPFHKKSRTCLPTLVLLLSSNDQLHWIHHVHYKLSYSLSTCLVHLMQASLVKLAPMNFYTLTSTSPSVLISMHTLMQDMALWELKAARARMKTTRWVFPWPRRRWLNLNSVYFTCSKMLKSLISLSTFIPSSKKPSIR